MIALLTANGMRSNFVNYELGIADSLKKPIIPLVEVYAESELPNFLKGRDYVRFDQSDPDLTIDWLMGYLMKIRERKAEQQRVFSVSS